MKTRSVLSPPVFEDPEKSRQAKLLHSILGFIIIAVAGLVVTTLIAIPAITTRALIILSSVTIMSGICYSLLYRGHVKSASKLFVGLFWLIVAGLTVTGGGTDAPAFIGFMIVVFLAGLLLSVRSALVVAAICLATELSIIYAEVHSLLPASAVHHTVYSLFIVHTFFFVLVVVFVFLYSKGMEAAYQQASRDLEERRRVEAENQITLHNLGERVKELTAIHGTMEILQRPNEDLQTLLREIANLLPSAFQYPEVTAARVRLGSVEAIAGRFNESHFPLRSEFKTHDGQQGSVEVIYYTEERPTEYEGPFLREERSLLDTIAEMLKTAYERYQANNQLQFFTSATLEGIVISKKGMVVEANEQFARMFGWTLDEILGKPLTSFVIEELRDDALENIRQQKPTNYEVVCLRKDGATFPAEVHGTPTNFKGEPARVTVVRDITERKRAEEAVEASEKRFRTLVEKAPSAIGIARDGKTIYVNQKYVEMYRYSSTDELVGSSLSEQWAPEHRAIVLERSRQRTLGVPVPNNYEGIGRRKDGSQFPVMVSVGNVDLADGPASLAFLTDITDQKQAQEALKESEKRFRELIESARDAIYTLSPDRIITSLNSAFERITGLKAEEWIGKTIDDIVHPADISRALENFNRHLEGKETPLYELRIKKKSGEYATGEFLTIPRIKEGKFVGVLGIARDVTERKAIEEQLRRTQRLDSIGSLASGIAHDLNNVLGPILLTADVLEKRTQDENTKKMLLMMRKNAKRGSEIVKQVLTFARGNEQEYKPQQLRYLINEIESFVKDSFPRNIELRQDAPKNLLPILGDQTQLHQVLLNLCVNARDAMPHGGRIMISAANATLSKSDVEGWPNIPPGEFVALSVADTGTGIPPEIQAKIFEPFFTTKEIGKGTGLGLSTVFSIVRDHKGFIRLLSEPGKGTEFKIFLPAIIDAQLKMEQEQKIELPHGNGEHILVVEDEHTLMQITRETLEAHGYTVQTALDGVEATMLFMKEPRGSIQLVFSDVDMPRMSGLDMTKVLLQHDPTVKILITSGASSGTGVETARANAKTFLAKPYTMEQLLQTIHTLLHKGGDGERS